LLISEFSASWTLHMTVSYCSLTLILWMIGALISSWPLGLMSVKRVLCHTPGKKWSPLGVSAFSCCCYTHQQ
jgi:hypothetical protein